MSHDCQPKQLWENFEKICQIPHPSDKEEKMTAFIQSIGEQLKLETIVDKVGNVIIRKPAMTGMENCKTVTLQGHLDMVPQKNADVQHDFEKDPIQTQIEGEWLTAKGTTLGADNSIGVAAALAILQSNDIQHGPIEALFTVAEETGMTGAANIKPGDLKGDILLNLDTEETDEIVIGCAGGANTDAEFSYTEEPTSENAAAYHLKITGLQGGHSGIDIHLQRANAIKTLALILWDIQQTFDLHLAYIEGGSPVHNAIPREALALIMIPKDKEQDLKKTVEQFTQNLKKVYTKTDPSITIELTTADLPETAFNQSLQHKLLDALLVCPDGVVRMNDSIPGLTETSTTLTYIKSDGGMIKIFTSQRSDSEFEKHNIGKKVQSTFDLAGATVSHNSDYPGWKPNADSEMVKQAIKVYEKMFGQKPKVVAIHAGLEFGFLGRACPNMDILAFGPDIEHAHSPNERVNIASVDKFWKFLLEILKNVPKR